ncbi:hypothetical protein EZS27_041550, partial [termite gut metagenome]
MELQVIQSKIYQIRGCRVIMFELTENELRELVTNCDRFPKSLKHSSVKPTVFTEQGVAMLSSVLRSDIAIEVNIQIMRAFVTLRQFALGYAELKQQ